MARQQERARRTRAAIIRSAAVEFGKSGYAAASLNRILDGSNTTKGAMYFHFDSKEDLARAVMETAVEGYNETVDRWTARTELHPFELLHGIVDEMALRYQHDVVAQAEFRLLIEPDFYAEVQLGSGTIWTKAAHRQARRAGELGHLRADVPPDKFVRTLTALFFGLRYVADLLSQRAELRAQFNEGYETLLEGMAVSAWLREFHATGWTTEASLDELQLG